MTEPDFVEEGIRQAMRRDAIQNMRWFISVVELSSIITPILLALIPVARMVSRHRVKAARLALPLRPLAGLVEVQESGCACGEAGSRGGLAS